MPIKRIDYIEGESAVDVMNRLVETREKDKKAGSTFTYQIFEFPPNQTIDINGEEIKCRSIKINRSTLDQIIKDRELYPGLERDSFRMCCASIEKAIGAPAINPVPKDSIGSFKLKSPNEIKDKLEIYRKRAKYELKNLREVYSGIDDPQNPKTVGGLEALNWLFNLGKGRTSKEISEQLYKLSVQRERDKLFYIHRQPNQPSLHVCQDMELMHRIELLRWSISSGNDTQLGISYGASRF